MSIHFLTQLVVCGKMPNHTSVCTSLCLSRHEYIACTYILFYLPILETTKNRQRNHIFFCPALSCYSFEIVLFVNLEYLSQKEKKITKYVRGKAVFIQKFLC